MQLRERYNLSWYIRYLIIQLLVLQVFLLVVFRIDLTRPGLLLLYAGLLVGAFLVWLAVKKPSKTRLGGTGCFLVLIVLLISAVLESASLLAYLVGLPTEVVAEHASALFTLVILLGPIISQWLRMEECYYQVTIAHQIKRDLGFESDTNTMNVTLFTARKYLFVTQIQTDGRMDQAGFRPYDIVVEDWGLTGFWQRLEESRGASPIAITVASWSDTGPVSKRPTRQLSVRVPRKNYSAVLEAELGFRCEVEYFKENDTWIGVVTVTNLQRGGLMDRAGFQDRDILLDVGGIPDLFDRLEQARGLAPVTLEVVTWLNPSDIADRPVRDLLLNIPSLAKGRTTDRWFAYEAELAFQRDLGFKQGWEWLPHQGKWHGWPIVEDLQPDGILARAGFQSKDILLESFSWRTRWRKARGKGPITVQVVSWMEPPPIRERVRRQLTISIPMRANPV